MVYLKIPELKAEKERFFFAGRLIKFFFCPTDWLEREERGNGRVVMSMEVVPATHNRC